MSLEQALAENTAAIRELIAALNQAAPVLGNAKASSPTPAAQAAASPATATKPAASEKKTPASGTSATTSSAGASGAGEGDAAASTTASSVDYPTLQKAVFALAGKSREAAAAVASSFGVKTFKDLPADKWAAALAAVNAKLTELESA